MTNCRTSAPFVAGTVLALSVATSALGQDRAAFDLPAIAAPASQAPPHLIVAPPLPEFLARGLAIIQYRADNLRIVPVFGPAALSVKPRIGHIHVTVDDAPWHWADASGEQLIIQGLLPGPHRVLIELADPTHHVIDSKTVSLEIPERTDAKMVSVVGMPAEPVLLGGSLPGRAAFDLPAIAAPASQEPARLIVAPPLPEFLARGLAIIQYRADNLRIVPVFGPAALSVKPRIGHIHVTVDDATWHWADASGEQLIIQGLTPGPHRVLVELADPTHHVIDAKRVSFEIPQRPVAH